MTATLPVEKVGAVKLVSRRGVEVAEAIVRRRIQRFNRRHGLVAVDPVHLRTVEHMMTDERIVVGYQRVVRP